MHSTSTSTIKTGSMIPEGTIVGTLPSIMDLDSGSRTYNGFELFPGMIGTIIIPDGNGVAARHNRVAVVFDGNPSYCWVRPEHLGLMHDHPRLPRAEDIYESLRRQDMQGSLDG